MKLIRAEEKEDRTIYFYKCTDEKCSKECKVTTFNNGLPMEVEFIK
jgi:hypothetical protein